MRTLSLLLALCLAMSGSAVIADVATPAAPPAPTATPAPAAKPKPLPRGVVQIQLEDLHCKNCAKKLARKLYGVPGVMRVRSSFKTDLVTINLQPKKKVSARKLWDAVLAAELMPVELRFDDKQLTKKHFPVPKTAVKPHAREQPAAKR